MKQWHLRDLFTDERSGKLRETKVWSNIGKAAMTVAFVRVTWEGAGTEWLWLTFGGVVVLHELGSKMLNQKQQQIDKDKP